MIRECVGDQDTDSDEDDCEIVESATLLTQVVPTLASSNMSLDTSNINSHVVVLTTNGKRAASSN